MYHFLKTLESKIGQTRNVTYTFILKIDLQDYLIKYVLYTVLLANNAAKIASIIIDNLCFANTRVIIK